MKKTICTILVLLTSPIFVRNARSLDTTVGEDIKLVTLKVTKTLFIVFVICSMSMPIVDFALKCVFSFCKQTARSLC